MKTKKMTFSRDRNRKFIASRCRVKEIINSLGRKKMATDGSTEKEERMRNNRRSKYVGKSK